MRYEIQICVISTVVISVLGGPREIISNNSYETHQFGPSITNFSIDIFKYMVNSRFNGTTKPENIIFSPSSAFRALLLLCFSSGGGTKAQLEKRLHIEGVSGLVSKYKKWKNSKSREVKEGDRLYRDGNITIVGSIEELLDDDIQEVDMSDSETVEKVNQWVLQITDGKIKQFLDEIEPETKLILLSAIYMKANWKSQFRKDQVEQATFTLSDKSTVQIPMMYKEDKLKYYKAESFECDVVSLDYKDSALKFVIFLPFQSQTIENLVGLMSREMINEVMTEMKAVKITLRLPKFKVEEEVDFVPLCKALGIIDVFDPSKANLTAFQSEEPLYVKEVLQKVVVNVDEEGTTAAAVTKIKMYSRSAGTEFTCDHPFAYMIYDSSSGTPLLLGTMMNPK